MKVFEKRGITAKGKILSREDFKLFRDIPSPVASKVKMEEVIKQAEIALDEPIPDLPLSLYREYHTNGNRNRFEAKFFRRRQMALWLSLAEWYEKKGRFTEKLSDLVWAILEESTWIIPAHHYLTTFTRNDGVPPFIGEEMLQGIDLFSATTCALLTTVYLFTKNELDGISVTICKKIEHMLHERITKPYLQCPFWWAGDMKKRVNNWAPWITENVMFMIAFMESDMDVRERAAARALSTLDNFIDDYAPDGGCSEGPSYWGAAGAALFDCLELMEDLSGGKISIYDSEIIKNIGDYIYKVNINGSSFVNFADCPPTIKPLPSLLVRYGQKCKSEFLEAFGRKQAAYGDFGIDYWQIYRNIKSIFTEPTVAESCDMPLISYMPNLMVMTARECRDSSKGTFMSIKGGTNDEMHNHNDVGNFIVYRNGKPVIIDAGVGAYTKQTFSADRYKLWFMQSGYHNLPSFDGYDQPAGPQAYAKCISYNESEKKIAFDLTNAYPEECGIEYYERNATLERDTVIIKDKFKYSKDGSHKTVFHIITATEPVINGDATIKLAEGMFMKYSDSLKAYVDAFDPVGMNAQGIWNTETLYRICFETDKSFGEYTFEITL